jgi:nitroreductase
MDFFDVVNKRVSVREYLDKPISQADIEKIIDAGRLAATARNDQPWRFAVVTGKDKLQKLSELVSPNGAFLKGAAAAIIVLSENSKYYLEDCSAATENILLAATALGIGTCWIAGDKKDYADKVTVFAKAQLGERLVSVVALGYQLKPLTHTVKKPLNELVRWL